MIVVVASANVIQLKTIVVVSVEVTVVVQAYSQLVVNGSCFRAPRLLGREFANEKLRKAPSVSSV